MGYVVRNPAGVVVYEAASDEDMRAWDVLHEHGKGATLWTGEGILLATCQGKFTVPVVGGTERVMQPRVRIRLHTTASPRAGAWLS